MSAATFNRRLAALEENCVHRISTLADLVKWYAEPNHDPYPEISPEIEECLESFRARALEKKNQT